MHYSQLQSRVSSTVNHGQESEPTIAELRMQGFISAAMLDARLRDAFSEFEDPGRASDVQGILCDLRAVSGYGSRTPTLARRWLGLAAEAGVRRVALIAASSVLRTAIQVISSDLKVELRCFVSEHEAHLWLRAASRMHN